LPLASAVNITFSRVTAGTRFYSALSLMIIESFSRGTSQPVFL